MSPPDKRESPWITVLLCVGPVLLLAACTVYGVTEVHSSTDTYIGLAGGRSVMQSTDGFPVADTYSYPFYGKPWINQNWLTHVWHYWLYSSFGPDAVIWGTWLMSTCIFLFTLMAVWMRSKSLLGAILAASAVAVGCRDFISARPATTGFFAISAMWMLVCALEGQGEKRRIWPIVGMFVLLMAWGCAHGSFVFGYLIFAMYAGYHGLLHFWRAVFSDTAGSPPIWLDVAVAVVTVVGCGLVVWRVLPYKVLDDRSYASMVSIAPDVLARARILAIIGGIVLAASLFAHFVTDRRHAPRVAIWQIGAIGLVLALAFVLTLVFGPFHWENFVHGEKVGASREWRSVSEWLPPYTPGNAFPPVERTLALFNWTAFGLVIAGGVRLALLFAGHRESAERDGARPHVTAFDVLAVGIGLIMTFFARRFAPVFFVFAAPTITSWIVLWFGSLPPLVIRWSRYGVVAAAWVLLLFLPTVTRTDKFVVDEQGNEITDAHGHKVKEFKWSGGALGAARWASYDHIYDSPLFNDDDNLLARVTRYDVTPAGLVDYLVHNDIKANVLTEWTQAGILMFYAPKCRVYMDGRAQQVYDIAHYDKYKMLMMHTGPPPSEQWYKKVYAELDRSGTDLVLLRAGPPPQYTDNAMQRSPNWVRVLVGSRGTIYARAGSDVIKHIRTLVDQGTEWRPDSADGIASRGYLWINTEPQLPQRAIDDWNAALDRNVAAGGLCYVPTVSVLLYLDRTRQAADYVRAQQQRLATASLPKAQRVYLQGQLSRCAQLINDKIKKERGS